MRWSAIARDYFFDFPVILFHWNQFPIRFHMAKNGLKHAVGVSHKKGEHKCKSGPKRSKTGKLLAPGKAQRRTPLLKANWKLKIPKLIDSLALKGESINAGRHGWHSSPPLSSSRRARTCNSTWPVRRFKGCIRALIGQLSSPVAAIESKEALLVSF